MQNSGLDGCTGRDEGADIVIIARSDARQAVSLDEALWRARAFAEAGADVLFIDALETVDELRAFCELGGAAASVPKVRPRGAGSSGNILRQPKFHCCPCYLNWSSAVVFNADNGAAVSFVDLKDCFTARLGKQSCRQLCYCHR